MFVKKVTSELQCVSIYIKRQNNNNGANPYFDI